MDFVTNENAKKYIMSLPERKKQSIETYIKCDNPLALDILDKMLEINPINRITAADALKHPFFKKIK